MKRLGILLSGRGSNFLAIHRAIAAGLIPSTEIAIVLSNKSDAPGLHAARDLGIPADHIPVAGRTPVERDLEFVSKLNDARVDLVCLAGYMRIVSPEFVAAFPTVSSTCIPASCRAFPASTPRRRRSLSEPRSPVARSTSSMSRWTTASSSCNARSRCWTRTTAETLSARILVEEHKAYPEAIARVLSGEFRIEGRRFVKTIAGRLSALPPRQNVRPVGAIFRALRDISFLEGSK